MKRISFILALFFSFASFGQRTGWQDLYTNPYYRNSIKVDNIHFNKRTSLATATTDTASAFIYNLNDTALYLYFKGTNKNLSGGSSGGTTIINNYGSSDTTIYRNLVTTGSAISFSFDIGANTAKTITDNNGSYFKNTSQSGNVVTVNYINAPTDSLKIVIVASKTAYTAFNGIRTNFGVYVNTSSIANNLTASDNLHAQYIRSGQTLNATAKPWKNYTDYGKKVYITLNFATPQPGIIKPFPTDTAQFRTDVESFFSSNDLTNVLGVNYCNEPNNKTAYWSGSAKDFIATLRIALGISKQYGIPATDGGLTGDNFYFEVMEDYENRGFHDSAEAFRMRTGLPPAAYNWRNVPAHASIIGFVDSLLIEYTRISPDSMHAVDVHYYEPAADTTQQSIDPLSFKQLCWYVMRKTGKPVITNEFGPQNLSPTIVSQLLIAANELHLEYALWYSGNDLYSLVNQDATLRTNGNAYKNYISSL